MRALHIQAPGPSKCAPQSCGHLDTQAGSWRAPHRHPLIGKRHGGSGGARSGSASCSLPEGDASSLDSSDTLPSTSRPRKPQAPERRSPPKQPRKKPRKDAATEHLDIPGLADAVMERLLEQEEDDAGLQLSEDLLSDLLAIIPAPPDPFLFIPDDVLRPPELTAKGLQQLLEGLGQRGGAEVAFAVWSVLDGSGRSYETRSSEVLLSLLRTAQSRADPGVALKVMRVAALPGCSPTGAHYSAAIGACARAADVESATRLFREMQDTPGLAADVSCHNGLILAHVSAGDLAAALQAYRSMKRQGVGEDIHTYRFLMTAATRAQDWDTGAEVLEWMTASPHISRKDVQVYSIMITGLLKAGDLQHAAQVMLSMPEAGVGIDPRVLFKLLNFCQQNDTHTQALRIFQSVRRAGGLQERLDAPPPQQQVPVTAAVCYAKMLILCHSAGDLDGCLRVYGWMKEDGVAVDEGVYSRLAALLTRNRQWRRCCEVVKCMRADGLALSVYTYGDLLLCLSAAGKWGMAMQEMRNMRQAHSDYRDAYVYHRLIMGAGESGQLEHVMKVLSLMEEHGVPPDVSTFNRVISACAVNKAPPQAFKAFHAMKGRGITPDLVTYSALITCCSSVKDLDGAERVWQWLREDETLEPDTIAYNAMIAALCNAGELERGLALLEEMNAQGVSSGLLPYDSLVSLYQRQGKWEALRAAVRVNEWMADKAMDPSAVTYGYLISRCERDGLWRDAVQLFEDMEVVRVKPDAVTLVTLISACGKAGQFDKALELKERMVRLGLTPSVQTYNALLKAAQAVGNLQAALELRDEMQVAGLAPDAITYCTLISTCHQAGGDWQVALQLFRDLQAAGIPPNLRVFNALLATCSVAGQWQQALQVFRYMMTRTNVQPDAATYACVIDAVGRARHWGPAIRLYEEAARTLGAPFRNYCPEFHPEDSATVDLHGLTLACAEVALRAWMLRLKFYHETGQLVDAATCQIITGRGLHSKPGGPRIKPMVRSLLDEGMGVPLAYDVPADNPGVLLVEAADLWGWLGQVDLLKQDGPEEQ